MPEVVLIGKDWQPRTLLRAQLLEEGVDVQAYQTFADAAETIALGPTLIIADLSESDNPSAGLKQLAEQSRRVPVWILASRSLPPGTELETRGFERVLFRPIRMGGLVDQIKRRLMQRH